MNELFAAFLGAVAAGLFQFVFAWRDRRKQTEAMLTAIVCEVESICRLIRHQGYTDFYAQARQEIEDGTWDGHGLIIDVRSNYFTVFESLAPQLGYLKPKEVSRIINFYAYCKSAIDSSRPDGPAADRVGDALVAEGILSVDAILRTVLALGEEISEFPAMLVAERAPLEAIAPYEQVPKT